MDTVQQFRENRPGTAPHRSHQLMWITLFLPIFYVLSVGPVAKVCEHFPRAGEIFGPMYTPLATLAEHSEIFDEFLTWYVERIWQSTLEP